MHDRYVYLDEKTIREYISQYGKKLLGKDYELGAAVILKGFLEKINGFQCVIGIKLNPRYQYIYQKNSQPLTVEQAKMLIEKHNDENDLVDIAISPVPSFRGGKNSAWIFQLKRFGHFSRMKDTDGLIAELLKIKARYTKTDAILMMFFDGHKGIDIQKVSKDKNLDNFPFSKIMFINTNKNKDDNWKINIGELWPGCGYNEYDPFDLVKPLSSL